MNIQKISIEKLKVAKYNPRRKLEKTDESYKKIKASIEEFGEELYATEFSQSEIDNLKIDFISDLLEDDYSTVDKELDKFAITFNIPKEHEEKFSKYIKKNGKSYLVEVLINAVEKEVL